MMKLTKTNFGSLIKEIRTERELTRYRLIKMSGMSSTSLIRIEETGNCTVKNAVKILNALGYELVITKKKE